MRWQVVNVSARDDGNLEVELLQRATVVLSEQEWSTKKGRARQRKPRSEVLAALATKLLRRGER
ncbi:MAG: hypothetical protein N2512_00355 [Armatimonadetes bacterium]|nr:hypothetical protein [Armatimonadota bacterium]